MARSEPWSAGSDGQHFHYVGSPNRYGLPPFYELHVWAWKHNPHGMFVDWNPRVSCAEYTGEEMSHSAPGHGSDEQPE